MSHYHSYGDILDITQPNQVQPKTIKVIDSERNRELFHELGYKYILDSSYLVLDYDSTLEILLIENEIFYLKI